MTRILARIIAFISILFLSFGLIGCTPRIIEKTQLSSEILTVTDYKEINNDIYLGEDTIYDSDWLLSFDNQETYLEHRDSRPELGDKYWKKVIKTDIFSNKNNNKQFVKTYESVTFKKIKDSEAKNMNIPPSL